MTLLQHVVFTDNFLQFAIAIEKHVSRLYVDQVVSSAECSQTCRTRTPKVALETVNAAMSVEVRSFSTSIKLSA